MNNQSGDILVIAAADYVARIAPAMGGALLSLTKSGVDILRAAPASIVDPREAACFACVPYFGRLPGGLSFDGRQYPLRPTLAAADPVNALHGDAWLRPWAVEDATACAADLSFAGRPSGDRYYPFTFTAAQRFSVSDSGLRISVCVRNDEPRAVPLGVALHPAFRRRPDTTVAFAASGVWTFDAIAGGGTETTLDPQLQYDRPFPLPHETVDHAYVGFAGRASVADGSSSVRMQTDASILHVFAPSGENYVCLEPTTHRPCLFGDDEAIAPGAERSLSLLLSA